MRVALSFPGCHRRGGVERVMLECANFLQARGHETHVYASQWEQDALSAGVIRHDVPVAARSLFMRLIAFSRRGEAAFANTQPRADVLGVFGVPAPADGVYWVTSVHKAWLEICQQHRSFSGRLKQKCNPIHPLLLAMERDYLQGRKYRKLVALTEQVKADVMRCYGVPGEDIAVLPNGYAPHEFNLTRRAQWRDSMRARLGYKESDKVVIFVANELERKGFAPLLRATAALGDPRVHLLVAGRVKSTGYDAEIQRLGMTNRVQFTGPVNDVATYYAAADVFALPTQYEAWGLVVVEALACGLPVLTSRLAGAAITVQEGRTGRLLNDPRDVNEIAAHLTPLLAGDHAAKEELAASVTEYAWPHLLLRYEDLLIEGAARA